MRVGYCHGGPAFCRWGAIYFQGDMGKYVIARKGDGAVLTSFHFGKAKIHTFRTPLIASRYIDELKLKGKPCIVRLRNVHYYTHGSNERQTRCYGNKIPKNWIKKGRYRGMNCFDYAPPWTKEEPTVKWIDSDWARHPWVRWEKEDMLGMELDHLKNSLWYYGDRNKLDNNGKKYYDKKVKKAEILSKRLDKLKEK